MKCRAGDKLPTTENIEQLKEVMNSKYKNLINIGVLSGFRISELLNLSLISGEGRNHIDFDNGKIVLSKQKNKRMNEPFILFPELETALKEHIEQNRSRIWACGEWLFWSKYQGKYRKLQRSTVLSMIGKYRDIAGLTEVYGYTKDGRRKHRLSMHSTRHYAINRWGRLCVEKKGIYDTNTISCLSRHSNPSSLESYRVLNEDIRRSVTQTLLW